MFASEVDSIGVTTANGKQFIKHKVEASETWYAVARKYGISFSELRLANKDIPDVLKVGTVLNVPSKMKPTDPGNQKNLMDQSPAPVAAPKPAAPVQEVKKPVLAPEQPAAPAAAEGGAVKHIVKPGETVYAISRKYNVKPADLIKWNNIKNNSLELGQELTINGAVPASSVRPEPKAPVAPAVAPPVTPAKESVKASPVIEKAPVSEPKEVVEKEVSLPAPAEITFAKNRREMQESGLADRIQDEGVNQSKYYALHRDAPMGTIIRVRNESNDRSVYVKVIGKLENSDGLVIRLSRSAADQLKAPNKAFKVDLLYGLAAGK